MHHELVEKARSCHNVIFFLIWRSDRFISARREKVTSEWIGEVELMIDRQTGTERDRWGWTDREPFQEVLKWRFSIRQ